MMFVDGNDKIDKELNHSENQNIVQNSRSRNLSQEIQRS